MYSDLEITIKRILEAKEIDPESIVLRQLRASDVNDTYVGWLNDPETNRFLEIRHTTPITVEDTIKHVNDREKNHQHHWGIFVDGTHVGNISCNSYNHIYRKLSISNMIGEEEYRRSNLCKLALSGAMDHLFDICNFHRIEAGTYSVHFSGITLLTNLGFKKEATLKEAVVVDGRFVDIYQFALLDSEWKSKTNKPDSIHVVNASWEN